MKNQVLQTPISSMCTESLEANYRLETVDLRTIRPFIKPQQKVPLPPIFQRKFIEKPEQLEFYFGSMYDKSIRNLRLCDSLDALRLPTIVKQLLQASHVLTLEDLITNKETLRHIRGVAPRQLEEIEEKITSYLGADPLEPVHRLELSALLRFVLSDIPLQNKNELLSQYKLFPATPGQRSQFCARNAILGKKQVLITKLKEITQAFIHPYLRMKNGIAETWEIDEYLLLHCCEEKTHGLLIIRLFEYLLDIPHIFHLFLIKFSNTAYVIDDETYNFCISVVHCAKDYFYTSETTYQLDQLVSYCMTSLAKKWIDSSEHTIRQILTLSDDFCLFQRKNIRYIQLAF